MVLLRLVGVNVETAAGEFLVFCAVLVVDLVRDPPDHELRVPGAGDGFGELFLAGVFEITSFGKTGGDEFLRAL